MNIPNLEMTKKNNHYPNPTIAEALCEIHFECDPSQHFITEEIAKLLKQELGVDYPSVTEQQIKPYQAAISEMGISVSVNEASPNTNRLIFKHQNRQHMVQFLPSILTINEVEKYPGWEVFLKDISRGWNSLKVGFPVLSAKRIGLRYINLIPRHNLLEPLSAWLKPNDFYPSAILNSTTKFLSRNDFELKKDIRLIVTLAEPIQKEFQGNVIFDIDVIATIDQKDVNWKIVNEYLERLHQAAWEVFSTSLSSKYETLLNGRFL